MQVLAAYSLARSMRFSISLWASMEVVGRMSIGVLVVRSERKLGLKIRKKEDEMKNADRE